MLEIEIQVNGRPVRTTVDIDETLVDVLRNKLGVVEVKNGCGQGDCGACTVLLDGEPVRSCLLLAVQADGHAVATVESLAPTSDRLHPLQQAFHEEHALQCGFCTPGFLMTLVPFLDQHPDPSEPEIRQALSGNLCRCTGYQNIVAAVRRAATQRRG
jgi:carbon-monoxide dehydrogenase small subunit